ncbi:hypothetical protein SAMN05519103_09628 [Rhizobiales bacterium GAS113]|nr:hypothetical protein SAMN05519103_09628 [Rhizobiales bacterium GAS113]
MTLQPFVNYNFPRGWYLTTSPLITANWLAKGDKWTVPVGGGFGRLFRIGELPVNLQLGAYYNTVTPKGRSEVAGTISGATVVSEVIAAPDDVGI